MTTTPPKYRMKLAVLTSGGDSAGMNAVVRSVVKAGILKCVLCGSPGVVGLTDDLGDARFGSFVKDTKVSSEAMERRHRNSRRPTLPLTSKASVFATKALFTTYALEMESCSGMVPLTIPPAGL